MDKMDFRNDKWVRIKDICHPESSGLTTKDIENSEGPYPVYGASGFIKNISFARQKHPYIAVVKDGSGVGRVMKLPENSSILGTMQYIIPNNGINIDYLRYGLEYSNLSKFKSGAAIPHIYFRDYGELRIRNRSEKEQSEIGNSLRKIEDTIDKYKRISDLLEDIVKSRFIEMFSELDTNEKTWPLLTISQICNVRSSKRIYQSDQSTKGIPFWKISDLTNLINLGEVSAKTYIPVERYLELEKEGQVPKAGDMLITSRGTIGQCYIVKANDKFYFQDGMISWLSDLDRRISPLYLSYLFTMPEFQKQIDSTKAGSTVAYLSIAMIKKLRVMVPDRSLQDRFIDLVKKADKSKLDVDR